MINRNGRSGDVRKSRVGLEKCGRKWVRGQAKRILPSDLVSRRNMSGNSAIRPSPIGIRGVERLLLIDKGL